MSYTTKSGRVLTDEDIEKLADEAERGYDIEDVLKLHQQQGTEHGAWLMLVGELRHLGVGDIERGGAHEKLFDLITLWGEELAQLRLGDPDPEHAARAIAEKREKWAEDWEK